MTAGRVLCFGGALLVITTVDALLEFVCGDTCLKSNRWGPGPRLYAGGDHRPTLVNLRGKTARPRSDGLTIIEVPD